MEAIIRTNDSKTFYYVVQILKSLHFEVETKATAIKDKKKPSEYAGSLPLVAANKLLKQIEQSRNQWDRNI